VNQTINSFCEAVGLIVFQKRMLEQINLICAEMKEPVGKRPDVMANQNSRNLYAEGIAQEPAATKKLKTDVFEQALVLLCKNPNFTFPVDINHSFNLEFEI
jgi:hypothetical protein